jgi:L-alanine-DL-glutamate epimerase-like enolase superfamily enzyme
MLRERHGTKERPHGLQECKLLHFLINTLGLPVMKIDAVDFFYLSMPKVLDIGDGSQDACVVRIRAGAHQGVGECEASPLVTIASYVCPMSHQACKPVRDSLFGETIRDAHDISRISRKIRLNSADLLQADHTLSGIDIALWDLLGKKEQAPVYSLLGYRRAYPKIPYASQLFGNTAQETLEKARRVRSRGFRAAKFGWGNYGQIDVKTDRDQVYAAREGLGEEVLLMVDAGMAWVDEVHQAALRFKDLMACRVYWLEEPFVSGALSSYMALAKRKVIPLAGGEGCHNPYMAKHMIDHGGVRFIQIDTGRIGGITPAKEVADYAVNRKVTFVNHTFTTHLALSASLQPFAGLRDHRICEYPVEATPLALDLYNEKLVPDANGEIQVPQAPGLGMSINRNVMKKYLVDTRILVKGKTIYKTPRV